MKTAHLLRSVLSIAVVSVLLLGLTACDPDIDNDGDNYKLFNTEWVSEYGTYAMTFEEPDYAFFYIEGDLEGSGEFEYDASKGIINFDVFHVISNDHEIFEGRMLSIVITDAEVSGNMMSVFFHELADDEEYYIELFKKK